MTDGKDGSDGEYQYSDSGGSHWWTLGTNTLLLSLVSFASDEQDVIMEEDDQKDDRNDDKDLPMFWPPDEPRVDTEEGIENELDTYHRGHPILAAYLRDMWHLGYVLKKLRRLDEEISKLQQKRRENNKNGLDAVRNGYELLIAPLKQECLLRGWIDGEGKPLPAAFKSKTEGVPTPNLKVPEKPSTTASEIAARTAIRSAQSPTQLKQRYSCLYCNKLFQRQCNLRKHTKIHTKPHACYFASCTLAFATNKDLKRHVEARHTSHEEKAEFVCSEEGCRKPFSRDNLLRHRKKAHGGT